MATSPHISFFYGWRMRTIGAIAGAVSLLMIGCTTSPADTTSSSADSECEAVVEDSITGFFAALNSGDPVHAASFFADMDFGTFAEAPSRVNPEASNRDTLLPYLTQRLAEGASFELVTLDYNGTSGNNLGNFGVVLRNEVDSDVIGLGAVDCDSGRIIILGLGEPE